MVVYGEEREQPERMLDAYQYNGLRINALYDTILVTEYQH